MPQIQIQAEQFCPFFLRKEGFSLVRTKVAFSLRSELIGLTVVTPSSLLLRESSAYSAHSQQERG